ncbi:hypothetical protein C8J57DRAFT_1182374 [Mycena rebaudengoi]|nr:hypothetical protein C8J57DRAFT_1182374 [Mycena rebaudengoi]
MRSEFIRFFLWMLIHDGYKVGRYWENIPGFEHRGQCSHCHKTASMQHTLLECNVAGQVEIWNLASQLWQKKTGSALPKPTMGQIMACGVAKKSNHGTTRLYRILMSESAHLIWRIRCERVIQGKNPASLPEIRNRWLKSINNRLAIDCARTNDRKYGKRSIKPSVVKQTWKNTLNNEDSLPKDWPREVGVLVGIGVS